MAPLSGRICRKASSGHNLILFIGIFFTLLGASVLSIDMAYYFAAQNQMRTASDAAALAATLKLFNSEADQIYDREDEVFAEAETMVAENFEGAMLESDDVELGFVDPTTMEYDPNNFTTPDDSGDYEEMGGYNAVRVHMRRQEGHMNGPLSTIMGKVIGVDSMDAAATSISMISGASNISNGGVRPIYACQGVVDAARADGDVTNDIIRIYGDRVYVNGVTVVANCPAPGSGNWGFADLRDCNSGSVGLSTVADWFETGYPGSVEAGQCYSTKPGNPIAAIRPELDVLIADQTVFPIPVYDSWGGSGSNTHVDVNSFVGFKATSYVATGSQANRHIEGRFQEFVCREGCRGGNSGSGVVVINLRMAPVSAAFDQNPQ